MKLKLKPSADPMGWSLTNAETGKELSEEGIYLDSLEIKIEVARPTTFKGCRIDTKGEPCGTIEGEVVEWLS